MYKIRLEIILKLYRIKWACIIMNNLLTLNEYDDINKIANQSIMKSIIYLEKSNRQIKDYLDFQNIIN